ncbi:hypothetical protein [Lentzea sp. NBRC 102530]|uniref:hypothetical protein n=1 Tax=Lentzea sp. NBRC 102530 TaxID=3032201 RepID=UPI0024A0FDCF|nr:hypothetical protein [Lentzea sp. NBRC 102530]GLY54844.1 hypothetical protein Lesp01_84990 [Lentzea sp. NBRC 102530]
MWAWFFLGYAGFLAVLVGYAVHIALSCPDSDRRKDAYRVLKLIWVTATGSSGVVMLGIQLHTLGLL